MRGIIHHNPERATPTKATGRPRLRVKSSNRSRKGEIQGSKRGDFTSLRGDSGEVGGRIRHPFGVGFSVSKERRADHKHRPHQHLNAPPNISAVSNTILRTLRARDRSYAAPCSTLLRVSESLREDTASNPLDPPHSTLPTLGRSCRLCAGRGRFVCWSCVVRASVMCWLRVGHVSICTAKRTFKNITTRQFTNTYAKTIPSNHHPTQLRAKKASLCGLFLPVSRPPIAPTPIPQSSLLRASAPPRENPSSPPYPSTGGLQFHPRTFTRIPAQFFC